MVKKYLFLDLILITSSLFITAAAGAQADITAASDKYAAVQSLKAYLSDLADCLAVKAPLVEELQESLDAAREEAAAGIRQQQQVGYYA